MFKAIFAVGSYAKEKLIAYCEASDEAYISDLKEKLETGEIAVKSYTVSEGERLWCIARANKAENGVDMTLDEYVNYVEAINEAMEVDVSTLSVGQIIYLPVAE